ncbi:MULTISPECIES: CBS domain-containing protein [Chromobacterium]|uniref:CBS domain-containing protein n=1 Tax=Chromobacterium TaxID=535 RepID=UPI000DF00FDE|nr:MULTISPECIES: CBS domain-containing protein [Chromobacterium]QOZ82143.1 CBS domain-containing protein [Chromobacterium sp. Rain0013]WON82158.1 CBS domain-containing protein [Chromobacterium haemolyticum]
MLANYSVLPTMSLPSTTDLVRLDQRPHPPVTLNSSALEVMTDLRLINPVGIHQGASLREAHDRMISHGIRLLFVHDGDGQFTGLITATDLLGERPIQCMKEHGKHYIDISVGDVMTPRKQLEALNLIDIEHASVGHMVATMKQMGRQHALVVELNPSSGHHELCGLFSTSHMARLLGMPLSFIRVPQALSEIQYSLLHAI